MTKLETAHKKTKERAEWAAEQQQAAEVALDEALAACIDGEEDGIAAGVEAQARVQFFGTLHQHAARLRDAARIAVAEDARCCRSAAPGAERSDTRNIDSEDTTRKDRESDTQKRRSRYERDLQAMAARKLPTVLTDDELAAILRLPNVQTPSGLRNKALLKAMAYGGLRVSEVCGLKTRDLRREDGRLVLEIRDGKGGRDRTVPLPDHAAETIETWLARRKNLGVANGHVFCTIAKGRNVHPKATRTGLGEDMTVTELTPGTQLNPRYIRALVARLAEKAGIEKRVTPHVLRHTAATRMLKAVGDVRRVQEFLGHADVSTTQVYTEVLAQDVAEAVDAVPDVEEEKDQQSDEADDLAAQVLAALPPEVREALMRQLSR